MKVFKKTIFIIIVLLIVTSANIVKADSENNQKLIFYLKNQGNYFSTINLSSEKILSQKIFPGSSGYFDIIINTQDYSFDSYYNLIFLNLKNKPQNLYFIIDDEKVNNIEEYTSLYGSLEKGKEKFIKRVYWKWDYESEESDEVKADFSFDVNLIVERNGYEHNGKKLPRTGINREMLVGVAIAIFISIIILKTKNKILKENNEINKNIK